MFLTPSHFKCLSNAKWLATSYGVLVIILAALFCKVCHLSLRISPQFPHIKARSQDQFLRIRLLLVPKNGSCEHIKNDLPSNRSVILKKRMEIEHALFHPTFSLKYERHRQILHDRFGAKLKILCQFWKTDRVNTLQMTFRHSHHKSRTMKSDRLNDCFQFLEPKIGSLKTDRVNGP